jgi:branched-subunit amino acid transport protein
MEIWLIMFAGGALTYLIRYVFIGLISHSAMPILFQRGLRFVPPAVLSAIILPELVFRSGTIDISFSNLRLAAGLVAILIAWKTRSALLTIAAGMATLWILQAFL